jgi:hypothetical protein
MFEPKFTLSRNYPTQVAPSEPNAGSVKKDEASTVSGVAPPSLNLFGSDIAGHRQAPAKPTAPSR